MKSLKIATIAYVSTFQKHLGETTTTAYAARENVADRLVAAAFEALEETHSVNSAPVAADLIDLTLGAAKEMAEFMVMTGQDGFVRGDLPEDIYADMVAEAREYLYGGLEDVAGSNSSTRHQA
jgi:hypothetical protein